MKLLGVGQLSVLLAGTLLFCHGAFGPCTWSVALQYALALVSTQRSITSRLKRRLVHMRTPRGMGPAPSTSPCSPASSSCS